MRKVNFLLVLAVTAGCVGSPMGENESANVESNPLKYRRYDVTFTNPVCGPYDLTSEVDTVGGGTRDETRSGAYCFPQRDSGPSGARPSSPLYNLLAWINGEDADKDGVMDPGEDVNRNGRLDPATGPGDEIFAAYFSFSNSKVKTALRDAARRGATVIFVKDSGQDNAAADFVRMCGNNNEVCDNVIILQRGNQNDVGYHHNKFLMVNASAAGPNDVADPDGTTYIRLVFSSGNMSSGTVLHQENWHFTEVARNSYFAQSHVCVMNALRDEDGVDYAKRKAFGQALDTCRASIQADPETDIGAFFLPSKADSRELRNRFEAALASASTVDVAAHRFSLFYMQSGIRSRLSNDPDFRARLVADDDLYWLYPQEGEQQDLGDNMPFESTNVWKLRQASGHDTDRFEPRYIETNSDAHLLHHNKFAVCLGRDDGQPDTVICGAANFTNDAFWYGSDSSKNNFENIYVIQIPHVVAAMARQFDGFWGETEYAAGEVRAPLATSVSDMAVEYTRAVEPTQ